MLQAISTKVSAYKSLPAELTKKINVNKTYKAARKNLNTKQAPAILFYIAGIIQFFSKNFSLGAVNVVVGTMFASLYRNDNKQNQQIKETLYEAYKEIVERAKACKKIKHA